MANESVASMGNGTTIRRMAKSRGTTKTMKKSALFMVRVIPGAVASEIPSPRTTRRTIIFQCLLICALMKGAFDFLINSNSKDVAMRMQLKIMRSVVKPKRKNILSMILVLSLNDYRPRLPPEGLVGWKMLLKTAFAWRGACDACGNISCGGDSPETV
jgi:hypothetical protein